jgi:hypothetical protein
VSFAEITLHVTSQLVFIFVSVYFVIDSVRKLLDTTSYTHSLPFYSSLSIRLLVQTLIIFSPPSFPVSFVDDSDTEG